MIGKYDLQRQVEDVIQFSQAYPFDLDCGPLIDKWYENKKPFIDLFGSLIYRLPQKIQVTITNEERKSSFASFINTLTDNGIFTKAQNYGDLSFLDFLYENKEGFLTNKVLVEHPELKITKNQRLLKVFRKFFLEDENTTRWVQDTASMYIQGNKIEGYLYLSFHPIDYLLLSETNCGWTSCHSLDGDYRYGDLNYMVDKTTVVAYLAETEEEHLRSLPPGMTWRSKKWRMLVHTNGESVVYYNKSYPFTSWQLIEEVWKAIHNLFPKQKFCMPMDIGFNQVHTMRDNCRPIGDTYISYMGRVVPAKECIDYSDYFGYKDLVDSATYLPIVSVSNVIWEDQFLGGTITDELVKKTLSVKIGERAPCPCCGQVDHYTIPDAEYLVCNDCLDEHEISDQYYLKCDSCGHRIYDEEEAFKFDNNHQIYCKKCFNALEKGDKEHGKAWRRSKRDSN